MSSGRRLDWKEVNTASANESPVGEVQRSRAASAEHITLEQMNYSAFIFLDGNSRIRKLKYTRAELIIRAFSDFTVRIEPVFTYTFNSA